MDIQNSKDSKDHISVDISDIKESSTEGNNPSDKDEFEDMASMNKKRKIDGDNTIKINKKLRIENQEISDNEKREANINVKTFQDTQDRNIVVEHNKKKRGRPRMEKNNSNIPSKEIKKRRRKTVKNEIPLNIQNQNEPVKNEAIDITNDAHNETNNNDLSNLSHNKITKGKRGRKPKNNEVSLNSQNQDKFEKNETIVIDEINNSHNEINNNDLSNLGQNNITKSKRGRKPKNNEISSNIQNQDKSEKNETIVIDEINNSHNEMNNNNLSNSDQKNITKGKRGRKPKNNEISLNIQNQNKSEKNETIVIDETNNSHNEIINNDLSNSDQNKITKGKRGRKPKNNEISSNIQDKSKKNEALKSYNETNNNDLSNSDQNKITKGKRGRKPKNNEVSLNSQNQDKFEKNETIVIDEINNSHNEINNNDLSNLGQNNITKGKRGRKPKNNEISSNIQNQDKSEKNETIVIDEINNSHNEIINNDLSNSDQNKITKSKKGRKPKNNEISSNIQNQGKSMKNATVVINEINDSYNEISNNNLSNSDQNKIKKGKRGRKPKNNEVSNIQNQNKSEKNEAVVTTNDGCNKTYNNILSNSGQNNITKGKRGRKPKNNEASSNIQNQDKSVKNETIVINETNDSHNEIINNSLSNSDQNKITKGKRGRKPKNNEVSSNIQNQGKSEKNETIVIDETNNSYNEISNNGLSNLGQNNITKGKRGRKPKNNEVSSNIQNQNEPEKNEAVVTTNDGRNETNNNILSNSGQNNITKGKRGRKPKNNEASSNIQNQDKSVKNETIVINETNDSHNEIINNSLSNSDQNKITKGKRGRKPKNNEVSSNIQNQDKSGKNETIVIDETNNSHNEINSNDSINLGQNIIKKGKKGRKPKNNEAFSNIQNQDKSEKNETIVIDETNNSYNEIDNNNLSNSDQNKIIKGKRGRKPKNNEVFSNFQDKYKKNEVINTHNKIITNDLSNSDQNKITKGKRGRKPKNNEISSNIQNQDKSVKNETILIDETNNSHNEITNNDLNKTDQNKTTKGKRGRKPKKNLSQTSFPTFKNIIEETNEVNLNRRLTSNSISTLSLNEEISKEHLTTENNNISKPPTFKQCSFEIVIDENLNKYQSKSDDLLNIEVPFLINKSDILPNRIDEKNKNDDKRDDRELTPILEFKRLNKEKKVVEKKGKKRKSTMKDPIEILSSPVSNSDENMKKRGRKRKSSVKNSVEIFSSNIKNSDENERKETIDDSDDMPTAEEMLVWSCNEHSREIKKSEINKLENKKIYEPTSNNIKDQDPYEIINSIFSSSDEDDLLVDKTLTIPGETVLAYYSDDRRYHPAKIISYSQKTDTYKLLFWTNYKKNLKRNKFYTKYQPEFLTVELGEQNTDKDEEELRHYEDKDLLDLIQEFIPTTNKFLEEYSLRYKNFIDEELSSSRTNKLLIENIFMGYFNTIEIEYIVNQFKLSLINKSLILDKLPLSIKPNEEKLKKLQEQIKSENSNKENEDNISSPRSSNYHCRSNTRGRDLSENISDSQKSNTSDSLTSCLRVNEVIYIDKLCRYVLLPEFTIWLCMKEEGKNYEESEKFCKNYKKNYDWANEVLHYRETFTSGRYFLMEHQKLNNY